MPGEIKNSANQAEQLAGEALELSCQILRIRLRFLDLALRELRPCPRPGMTLLTDGAHLYYGAGYILRRCKDGRDNVARELLHLLLHCVLRHMFVGMVNRELWDLACDLAAEQALLELSLFPAPEDAARRTELEKLRTNSRYMTAEHLYHSLRTHPPAPEQLEELSRLFRTDDHQLWYHQEAPDREGETSSDTGFRIGQSGARAEERWQNLGQRMQVDLETVSSQWGDIAAGLVQSLRRLNRQKYDYTAFLKKFAVMGEDMAVNDDEFDPIFYTYGLRMYKRLPLIEPLEYREAKRIREFVIAVDTSGSVAGELVQKFIRKTYHILLSTESFFSRINLHILQCDADIQQDVRITCQENLDQYLKTMTLHGFGGTDFRPVFAHVDQLIRKGEFTNLRGLIYFTDGYGIYPSQKPPYETAFIFLEQEEEPPEVPVWAIRLILPKEDTEDEQQESGK